MVSVVDFWVRDMSGQRRERIAAPTQARVGDYTDPLLESLQLPRRDVQGNALSYRWRNETQSSILPEAEPIGRVVAPDDEIQLMSEPVAG